MAVRVVLEMKAKAGTGGRFDRCIQIDSARGPRF